MITKSVRNQTKMLVFPKVARKCRMFNLMKTLWLPFVLSSFSRLATRPFRRSSSLVAIVLVEAFSLVGLSRFVTSLVDLYQSGGHKHYILNPDITWNLYNKWVTEFTRTITTNVKCKYFLFSKRNQIAQWSNSEVAKLQGSKNLFCVIEEQMKKVTT